MAADRPICWEDVPCPLCGARAEGELLRVCPGPGPERYRLVACRQCGMVYMNPRPDEASIGRFYPDDYEWYQPPTRRVPWWRQRQEGLRRLVMSRLYGNPPPLRNLTEKLLAVLASPFFRPNAYSLTAIPYQGRGRLLDYGCGAGWFAHRMQQLGWDVTAMDFTEAAVARVARRYNLPVLAGTLPHPDVGPESFDVITMGAVLEHVHHPRRVIEAAARALRPGGYLAVSVPNLASWGFRYFGEDWWGLQIPQHLLHFTPATLGRLLTSHGLEVRREQILRKPGWMRRSLKAAARREGRPRLLVRLGQSRAIAGLLSTWAAWRKQGDCLVMLAYRPVVSVSAMRRAG